MSELVRTQAAELDGEVEVLLVETANVRGALETLASNFAAPAPTTLRPRPTRLTDARGERYEWWLGRVIGLFRRATC